MQKYGKKINQQSFALFFLYLHKKKEATTIKETDDRYILIDLQR